MRSRLPLIILNFSILVFFLQSCAPDDDFSISGSLQFSDNNSAVNASVYLFQVSPPDAYQSIVYEGASYPVTGAAAPHNWYFDHRQQTAISQTSFTGSAAFEFNKVSKNQYYRVVAAGDEYGWIYSGIFKLTEDENIGTLTLYPETELPSVIDQNMVLESGRHYIVENTVQHHQDFILTIEPGVWIRFKNSTSKLQVLGILQAIGDESDYIRFTYYDNSSSASNWSRLEFANDLDSLSALSYAAVDHASVGITVNNCRLTMDNTVVRQCGTGISISSLDYSDISNSSIISCATGIDCNSLMCIDRCYVADCNLTGISLSNQSGYIDNSVIVKCGTGIIEDYSDIFEIEHCIVAGNDIGIWFEAGNLTRMSVHYTDFYDNSVEAVYCELDAYPDLSYNNLYQNEINIYLHGQAHGAGYHQSENVTALNCFWGETNIDDINALFHDGNTLGSDPRLGFVLYDPFELNTRPDTGPQ